MSMKSPGHCELDKAVQHVNAATVRLRDALPLLDAPGANVVRQCLSDLESLHDCLEGVLWQSSAPSEE